MLPTEFTADQLTPAAAERLLALIDGAFLDGRFGAVCGPPRVHVRSALLPEVAPGLSARQCAEAVAGFEPHSGAIVLYTSGWDTLRGGPGQLAGTPVQCDGVYCFTRLEWLCHALAHEMVHALVMAACPTAAATPLYLENNGHGLVFQRVNRRAGSEAVRGVSIDCCPLLLPASYASVCAPHPTQPTPTHPTSAQVNRALVLSLVVMSSAPCTAQSPPLMTLHARPPWSHVCAHTGTCLVTVMCVTAAAGAGCEGCVLSSRVPQSVQVAAEQAERIGAALESWACA